MLGKDQLFSLVDFELGLLIKNGFQFRIRYSYCHGNRITVTVNDPIGSHPNHTCTGLELTCFGPAQHLSPESVMVGIPHTIT